MFFLHLEKKHFHNNRTVSEMKIVVEFASDTCPQRFEKRRNFYIQNVSFKLHFFFYQIKQLLGERTFHTMIGTD